MKGAQPSDTERAMSSYRGVMLKRPQIGVGKSVITQEQADAKLAEWVKTKTDKIQTRIEGLSEAKHSAAKARKDAETKVKEARKFCSYS